MKIFKELNGKILRIFVILYLSKNEKVHIPVTFCWLDKKSIIESSMDINPKYKNKIIEFLYYEDGKDKLFYKELKFKLSEVCK